MDLLQIPTVYCFQLKNYHGEVTSPDGATGSFKGGSPNAHHLSTPTQIVTVSKGFDLSIDAGHQTATPVRAEPLRLRPVKGSTSAPGKYKWEWGMERM